MPRKPRQIVSGSEYHLISRFVDREWFITGDSERKNYLRLLGRSVALSDWHCLAYAVMSNHIHLYAVAGEDALSSWIRRVHAPFADAINKANDRIGPVFVRGPKAFFVPPEKSALVLAYIHNNPVRANVVLRPGDSDWTSHRAYAGLARCPRWLHADDGLRRAQLPSGSFDAWVRDHPTAIAKPEASAFDALELEEAVEADEQAPIVDADELVRFTASQFGLTVEALRSRRKQDQHVRARRVVALCGDRLGLSGVALARSLGISQQCVSKILIEANTTRFSVSDALVDHLLQQLASST